MALLTSSYSRPFLLLIQPKIKIGKCVINPAKYKRRWYLLFAKNKAIIITVEILINVLITETYRSQERQDYLYQQGRTRSGKVVTWTHNSRHTSRRAWDVCQNIKGKEYSDANFFKKCGEIAKKLGITWGGTWKSSPDTPHFEISTDWKSPKTISTSNTNQLDKDLGNAVSKIIKSGIILDFNSWKRVDLINPHNAFALIVKLGGVDLLISKGIISDKKLWTTDINKVTKENIASLLIKYASKL